MILKLYGHPTPSQPFKQIFLNNLRLFDFETKVKNLHWVNNPDKCKKLFASRVHKSFELKISADRESLQLGVNAGKMILSEGLLVRKAKEMLVFNFFEGSEEPDAFSGPNKQRTDAVARRTAKLSMPRKG